MGMGVHIGPMSGPAWERHSLYLSAFATQERRQKTWMLRNWEKVPGGPVMDDWFAKLDQARKAHPFPDINAPEAELKALGGAYREALAEYYAVSGETPPVGGT